MIDNRTHSEKPDCMRLRGAEELALALATGCTNAEAARRAGLRTRTVYARKRDPEFTAYVRGLRAELLDRAGGRLADGAARAAEVLVDLLDSDSEQTRLAAARALLEHVVRVKDVVEVEERLAALEQRAQLLEIPTETPNRIPERPSWPSPADVRDGKKRWN